MNDKKFINNTRILYLTQNCNLKCTYCYEKNRHQNKSITKKQIDKFLNDLCNFSNPEIVSTICFFGGEPFLEFDKILYTVNRCREIKKNTGKGFAFNTITNGTLVYDFVPDLYNLTHDPDFNFTLHVSYDGLYQQMCRTPNSYLVEENLLRLLEYNVPFGISYTISGHNSDYKKLTYDLIKIIQKFFHKETKETIRINWDYNGLADVGINPSKFISGFREYLLLLYKKFGIPFCHETCKYCGRCKRNRASECVIDVLPDDSGIVYKIQNKEKEFDLF